tara:strand:- start:241 stop:417 length:177 start_codon:yes stop_codon:yes gene_type:complete
MTHSVQIKENPPKYCSKFKREVYQTVHWADGFYVDWYEHPDAVYCAECYGSYKKVKKK